MEGLVVKIVENEEERRAAFSIRMRVFVEEQGVPAHEEIDVDDFLPRDPDYSTWGPSSVSGLRDGKGKQVGHAIALVGGKAVGAGRVVYSCPPSTAGGHLDDPGEIPRSSTGEARIGRMAVDKAWRRRGIGSLILKALEAEAARRGMAEAVLHAQTYVNSFYSTHGYIEEGDVFLEVGIEHVQMRKRL